jgi:hypothetical protein
MIGEIADCVAVFHADQDAVHFVIFQKSVCVIRRNLQSSRAHPARLSRCSASQKRKTDERGLTWLASRPAALSRFRRVSGRAAYSQLAVVYSCNTAHMRSKVVQMRMCTRRMYIGISVYFLRRV